MSEGLSLRERVMPQRAAASKAERLAAEQLDNSSEEEGGAQAFGEPSRVTKRPVKFTYAGKARSKPSPKKPRPKDVPHKRDSSIEIATIALAPGPHLERDNLTVRERLDTHMQSDTEESSLSSLTNSDVEDEAKSASSSLSEAPSNRRSVPKPEPTSGYEHPSSSEAVHPDGRTSRKRVLSQSPSSIGLNSPDTLTPLSSPEPDIAFTSHRTLKGPNGRLAEDSPGSSKSATKSVSSVLSTAPSRRSPLSLTRTSSSIIQAASEGADTWSLDGLGTHVWVKVDTSGRTVGGEEEYDDADFIWWPAQVVDHAVPLRVSLFGDSPGSQSHAKNIYLSISDPSWWNIRSMTTSRGLIRFNETTSRLSGRPTDTLASPRKKHKSDVVARWGEALNRMLQADEDDNDGLPAMLSAHIEYGGGSNKGAGAPNGLPRHDKTQRGTVAPTGWEATIVEEKPWRAPSANFAYELPGELVLAKEKRANTDYWPAQLLEYVKPRNPKEKPKYRVGFYDGTTKVLEEGMFYATSDDGFRTCTLGRDRFNYELDDERDDPLAADTPSDEEEPVSRASSPIPSALPPPAFEFDLTLSEQFDYIKPVLAAVVEGAYEPAQELHDAFMRGEASRRKVTNTVSLRGSLRHHEVEELGRLVRRWARRQEKRKALPAAEVQLVARGPAIADGGSGVVQTSVSYQASSAPLPSSPLDTGRINHESVSEAEEPPPSSFATTDAGEYVHLQGPSSPRLLDDGADLQRAIAAAALCELSDASARKLKPRPLVESKSNVPYGVAHNTEMNGSTIIGAESSVCSSKDRETAIHHPRTAYADLSDLDKLTYCTDVLLREAVLQLLLWRSRSRTVPELQAPEEERRLHNLALEQAEETYWVHDIIRMKRAAEGSMLPPSPGRKPAATSSSRSLRKGGTRSRPSLR